MAITETSFMFPYSDGDSMTVRLICLMAAGCRQRYFHVYTTANTGQISCMNVKSALSLIYAWIET